MGRCPERKSHQKGKWHTIKDDQHHLTLGYCKLKQWGDITHLLNWLTPPTVDEDAKQQELSFIDGENAKWYNHFGKQSDSFLTKLNIILTYDPAIMLLGNYSTDTKTYVPTKTCTQMFIATLFIIVKTGSN